jgi:hypothetical protein
MSGRSTIHINGRSYDATQSIKTNSPSARSIDGMVGGTAPRTRTPSNVNNIARKPQKTAILHRKAVKKPQSLSDITPAKPSHPQHVVMLHKTSVHHRTHIQQSPQIKKFSDVAPAPAEGQHYHSPAHATPPPAAEPVPAPPPVSKSSLMVERQLRLADAHSKQLHKKKSLRTRLVSYKAKRGKYMNAGALALAGFLVIGFAAYQNSAGISMQIANRRAGFSAAIPSYTPGGYALKGPVQYSPGKVIVSFSSTTNDKSYQIEQRPTQWSDDTLQEQVASANGGQYQTFQAKGMKIFFSGNNSATWVDDGVLYELRGDSGLASEQVASIASSM